VTGRPIRTLLIALSLLAAAASGAGAQGRPGAPVPRPGQGRPALERLAAAVQRQLGLTNEQAAQLRDATRQFALQRDQLNRRERATRLELRGAVVAGDSADQQRVARLLDDMVRLQRRRVDLLADEQRELAKILTPVQRAQFMAMQERAMRAAQQLRANREAQQRGVPPRRPRLQP
jgi:Spy/CpxP family protein refolding chaperone